MRHDVQSAIIGTSREKRSFRMHFPEVASFQSDCAQGTSQKLHVVKFECGAFKREAPVDPMTYRETA
jgi:hypothetical protein